MSIPEAGKRLSKFVMSKIQKAEPFKKLSNGIKDTG
jgi:hypothetical protein